jgi:uncharacterized protein DUF4145
MANHPERFSEYGFKIPDVDNVLDPDPLSKIMYSMEDGVARPMAPNDILRALETIRLSEEIPLDVRRAYRTALGAMAYAYWYYPLYTMTAQQLLRVADFALDVFMKGRGIQRQYGLASRIADLSRTEIISDEQRTQWDAIRRLRNSVTHPNFHQTWGIAQAYDVAKVVADAISSLPWDGLDIAKK